MALDDGTELANLLQPHLIRLLEIAWDDAKDAGLVSGAFDLNNEYFADYLEEIGLQIRGIAETTRERVRELLSEADRDGLTVEDLAQRFEESGLFGRDRARSIAHTESARGYSLGSLAAYRASGVVDRVEWLTTNPCTEVCDALNGKIVPIGEEFAAGIGYPPAHPNCRCAVAPVVAGT